MKKILLMLSLSVILSSCAATSNIPKSTAYQRLYEEVPTSVLIMPPINRSTNVEAKEYFHSTLSVPIANAGYYVIPPFLSMEILKRESAYDSELFIEAPLDQFRSVFGADMAVFTIIHRWDKSSIAAKVLVEVEYIIKSTKTNRVIYARRGNVTYDATVESGVGGAFGALLDIAASAINTAATKYVDVARVSNKYTFTDLPAGVYSPKFMTDGTELAGKSIFSVNLP